MSNTMALRITAGSKLAKLELREPYVPSHLIKGGKIYETDLRYRVKVSNDNGAFRASTNDNEVYALIKQELKYRHTFQDAVDDLDAFAIRHGLKLIYSLEMFV